MRCRASCRSPARIASPMPAWACATRAAIWRRAPRAIGGPRCTRHRPAHAGGLDQVRLRTEEMPGRQLVGEDRAEDLAGHLLRALAAVAALQSRCRLEDLPRGLAAADEVHLGPQVPRHAVARQALV